MGCLIAAAAWVLQLTITLGMVAHAAACAASERLLGEDHPLTRRLHRAEDEYWSDFTIL
ncbi:MAG TPA: hypothetical protein VFL91_08510 [Thermomicrobiales bacterium]|nr:hypothetical protein [Thermomicrobiales bacterium]